MMNLPANARVPRPAFRRRQLDNGLTILIIEDERVPAISISLMAHAGGSMDPAGRAGTASLAAGLMNKGSRQRDAEALALAVDDLGATFGARTGRDSTLVNIAGLSEDFHALLGLLAEITLEPTYPEDEFNLLRQRRLNSLTRALDDPSTLADWAFSLALFKEHPYGAPLAGTASSVAAIHADDPAVWHQRAFTPANCCLAIAGATPAEEVLKAVQKAFGSWVGDPMGEVQFPEVEPVTSRLLLVDRQEAPQAQIRWGHMGLARRDPRHDAADLVNDVLGGGGFSSRLMQTIRSEKGLTYGIHSGFSARRQPGPFLVSTFTPTDSVAEVLDDIHRLVKDFRDHGPSQKELDDACRRLVGGYPLQFETATQVAGQLLELEFYGLAKDSLETYQDRMLALTLSDAATLARDLLQPESALAVVVGDTQSLPDLSSAFAETATVNARDLFGVVAD